MSHTFIFYLNPENISGEKVAFSRAESHHIGVLRLGSGCEIEAMDGRGRGYLIRLETKYDRIWQGVILDSRVVEAEAPVSVWLALPCLKGDRWESALEAACEIGIAGIWLTDYHNSAVSWTLSRRDKSRRKAIEALKQSGGYRLTAIAGPVTLTDLLKKSAGQNLYLADGEGLALSEIIVPALILVGPEAGLHPEERELLRAANFHSFSLGPRRLRAEVASLAALAQASLKLSSQPKGD